MHNFSPLLQVASQLFYQLYTIHGCLCERLLPLLCCSISSKSEDIYAEIFPSTFVSKSEINNYRF